MKKVIGNYYVHRTNLEELEKILPLEEKQKLAMHCLTLFKKCIHTEIVKYNSKTHTFTFIDSPDWDIAYEPLVGNTFIFKSDGSYTKIIGGNKVYHRKHEFVNSDYTGFNIEQSKQRTLLLDSIPEIKENKNRIGSLLYWMALINKYKLPIFM